MLADILAQGAAQDLAQGLVAVGGDALGLLLERRFDADHDERFCCHTCIISCNTRYVYVNSLGVLNQISWFLTANGEDRETEIEDAGSFGLRQTFKPARHV